MQACLIPILRQKCPQGIVGAFNVVNHPALRTVDQDEIHRHGTPTIVEADRDIGLVELLAQDGDADSAQFPGLALDQKVLRRLAGRMPGRTQAGIEELTCGVGVVWQAL